MRAVTLLLLAAVIQFSQSVDRNNFKTCDQSSFCRRARKHSPVNSVYNLNVDSLKTYKQYVTADIVNNESKNKLNLKLEALKGNTFHIEINEKNPLKARYKVVDALHKEPTLTNLEVTEMSASMIIITSGSNKVVIHTSPFEIHFYDADDIVLSVNTRGFLRLEELKKKTVVVETGEDGAAENEPEAVVEKEDPGAWEENFRSHHDSKPNGPEAIALDFTFPQSDVLFGIPEHADSFILRNTNGQDPYRLYNLDVFEYELDSTMALYGSVPVIYGHGAAKTAGVYWQNAAETWVDVFDSNPEDNILASIVNLVAGAKPKDPPGVHFMSESGIIDAYIMMGPKPNDVFKQFTDLTGVGPLPQMYALGYHQCRWNYNDEDDVAMVHAKFDEHDIPVDTFWLDIEYTDAKKYFTWDHHKFPHPLDMIRNLTDKGRHLTVIIDPHIKRDGGYFFHNDCTDRGYYTKNKDGKDYEGWCWPGSASYPDFFDPTVRNYYADQYLLENFKESTADLGLWNDMNEPSVFNGPEVTMLKDNLHYGGWEHRDVHNLYGHMHIMASFDGLIRRSNGAQRPFILTRAHFAGSQRYAAVWTGDNMADWNHLKASVKMCLSLSVSGISFCGADVGGFFGNPDGQLFSRWYQAAAFQPFFRSHSHIDTKRREPWLYSENVKKSIREAIRKRYSYLPMWYTFFYEHERFGLPIMRPMLSEYPGDKAGFSLDSQYMLGDKLLVSPVTTASSGSIDVYFPQISKDVGEYWYEVYNNFKLYSRPGSERITVGDDTIPVFQRGGTIIAKKERIRRAATLMHDDPYTLVVALDKFGLAKGTLYIDDEISYEYRARKFLYLRLQFGDLTLSSSKFDEGATYPTKTWLERVVLVGLKTPPKSANLFIGKSKTAIPLEVVKEGATFVIRKPGVSMLDDWNIKLVE